MIVIVYAKSASYVTIEQPSLLKNRRAKKQPSVGRDNRHLYQ